MVKESKFRVFRMDRDLLQAWLRRSVVNGKNKTGNLYFHGDSLYSYGPHFKLGVRLQDYEDKTVVLINKAKTTATTARQRGGLLAMLQCEFGDIKVVQVDGLTKPIEALEIALERCKRSIPPLCKIVANGKMTNSNRKRLETITLNALHCVWLVQCISHLRDGIYLPYLSITDFIPTTFPINLILPPESLQMPQVHT